MLESSGPGRDDVYYYIRWRLKLEGETENMCVCTKERKGVAAAVLMATPCTNSLGGVCVTRPFRRYHETDFLMLTVFDAILWLQGPLICLRGWQRR